MVQISTVVSLLITAAARVTSVSALSVSSRATFVQRQAPPLPDPTTLPTQCQEVCTPIINAAKTCTDAACLCTTANRDSLQSCAQCLFKADPQSPLLPTLQSGIDAFNGACPSVPPVSLSTAAAGPTARAY